MVKKNEYPRRTNISKDGVKISEPVAPNSSQKTGEAYHKENNTRNARPPRENQLRENNSQQKVYQHRELPKKENNSRDSMQQRDNAPRSNAPRENATRDNAPRENYQKSYQRENTSPNREKTRDNREPHRQHYQRSAIKPQTEETVEDIALDIVRIEKEIELELKEIKSLRLGV